MLKFRVHQFKLCSLCRWKKERPRKDKSDLSLRACEGTWTKAQTTKQLPQFWSQNGRHWFCHSDKPAVTKALFLRSQGPCLTFFPFCTNSRATRTVHFDLAGWTSTTFDKWISSQQHRLDSAARECHVFRWVNSGTDITIYCNSRKVWEVLCVVCAILGTAG